MFFEKTNKTDNPLESLIKKKERILANQEVKKYTQKI